jgi:hypothetical protein
MPLMRVMIQEYAPYVNECAVTYNTLTPTENCRKPGLFKNILLCLIVISSNNITGVFAEFAFAVLSLAHINYTLIAVDIHNASSGFVSFDSGYDNNTDWFKGEMGKMGTKYDMIVTAWTLPNVKRQEKLLFFEPGLLFTVENE